MSLDTYVEDDMLAATVGFYFSLDSLPLRLHDCTCRPLAGAHEPSCTLK